MHKVTFSSLNGRKIKLQANKSRMSVKFGISHLEFSLWTDGRLLHTEPAQRMYFQPFCRRSVFSLTFCFWNSSFPPGLVPLEQTLPAYWSLISLCPFFQTLWWNWIDLRLKMEWMLLFFLVLRRGFISDHVLTVCYHGCVNPGSFHSLWNQSNRGQCLPLRSSYKAARGSYCQPNHPG